MKHLGLVHILLLLGVGLLLGPAVAELTAYQNLMPSAEVGQMVTVTVSLTYNGLNSTQAMVTPSLPPGVVANAGGQSTELYPGVMQQISYPLTAQQSGTYLIVSEISYAEDGTWRNLRLEAPFTAQLQLCQNLSRNLAGRDNIRFRAERHKSNGRGPLRDADWRRSARRSVATSCATCQRDIRQRIS